ncbi:hypothetical protein GCM10009823_32360 [Brevibacterium salitolerans]|uniref:Uncharacterized protein n=1 Tax=Brevibacterium salitolerans TaxID=1403566 RepID=A0ABN2X6S8_9MICO
MVRRTRRLRIAALQRANAPERCGKAEARRQRTGAQRAACDSARGELHIGANLGADKPGSETDKPYFM